MKSIEKKMNKLENEIQSKNRELYKLVNSGILNDEGLPIALRHIDLLMEYAFKNPDFEGDWHKGFSGEIYSYCVEYKRVLTLVSEMYQLKARYNPLFVKVNQKENIELTNKIKEVEAKIAAYKKKKK